MDKEMDIIAEMIEANRLLNTLLQRISALGALAMM